MEQVERLRGEHVEAGSAIDEGPGDCHVAGGGGAEHWECACSRRGSRVNLWAEGEVVLGLHLGGAYLAVELLHVAVGGWPL